MNPTIKAGDKVKQLPNRFFHKGKLKSGVVTEIRQSNPLNPVEEHGSVAVLFDDGQEEHYVHSNWQEFLKIVE